MNHYTKSINNHFTEIEVPSNLKNKISNMNKKELYDMIGEHEKLLHDLIDDDECIRLCVWLKLYTIMCERKIKLDSDTYLSLCSNNRYDEQLLSIIIRSISTRIKIANLVKDTIEELKSNNV